MRTLFFVAILIASTLAAYQFQGNIRISNDPAINGILTGQIFYTFNSYNQFDTGNNYKIVYSGIGTGTITEILKTVLTSGTNQNIRYLICGTTCDAQTYSANFPAMQYDTSRFTAAGSDSIGFKFTRSGAATDVTAIWYSTSTGGTIRQAQFGNGKIWAFDGVSLTVPANSFSTTAYTCPTPTCTVVADIVQVIDDSGSISTANFNNAVRPFAVNVCNSYDWAVGGAAGITMAGVFFSSNARTILAWTTSKSSAINAFNTASKQSGNTCISCGVTQARTLFDSRLSGRASVSKLVFFMTDGYHNVPSGSTIYASVDASKAAGITTVAIGVGSSVSSSQLQYIASSISGVQTVFQVNDFNALANIKNQLVGVTCTTFQGSPCGSNCKGFCSCGATCICPQCDTTNQCLVGSCTVGQFSTGCTYADKVCNDNNACTSNLCNPSLLGGCYFPNITSTCIGTDACVIYGCSDATGCTAQQRVCTSSDPCYRAVCNSVASPGSPAGCQLLPQTCDTCKIPVSGGRSNNTRPCPDPNSPNANERPDGDLCKDWYCDPADSYASSQYSGEQIGRCKYTSRTCSNNACTNNTCVPSTGNCNSVDISNTCIDSNPCTHDSCDPVSGCSNVNFTIAECYALTGGQFSHCFEYILNSSIPTCCQAINRSFEWCGKNNSDSCLQWQCLDLSGCDYFTRDCEAEIGLEKLGDCQSATCENVTGCRAVLSEGKSLDTCGYCADSDASRENCVVGLNTAEIAGISAGIVAAIIIAIIVICLICGAVGGKVGLDYYRKYKGKMNNLQSNPLYEDKQKGGVNPFYQESEMSAK